MLRSFAFVAMCTLIILAGCSKEDNPAATPEVTSSVYLGGLHDSVLAAALPPSMNYDTTKYRYSLYSDNTFKVEENIGMGWTSPAGEEGTYTVSDSVYFTPTIDRHSDATHQMVPTDSLRHAYTGVISNDTLTISNFINIDTYNGWRNLGTLTLKK
ncbi:MAG: hypothetical protein V1913_08035 [Fibrobacterota bacterium]